MDRSPKPDPLRKSPGQDVFRSSSLTESYNTSQTSKVSRDIMTELNEQLKNTHDDLMSNLSLCSDFQPTSQNDRRTEGWSAVQEEDEVHAYYTTDSIDSAPSSWAAEPAARPSAKKHEDFRDEGTTEDVARDPEYASSYTSNVSSFYGSEEEVVVAHLREENTAPDNPFAKRERVEFTRPRKVHLSNRSAASTEWTGVLDSQSQFGRVEDTAPTEGKEAEVAKRRAGVQKDVHPALRSDQGNHERQITNTNIAPPPRDPISYSLAPNRSLTQEHQRRRRIEAPPMPPTTNLIGPGKHLINRLSDPLATLQEQRRLHNEGLRSAHQYVANIPSELGDPNEVASQWPESAFLGVRSHVGVHESPSTIHLTRPPQHEANAVTKGLMSENPSRQVASSEVEIEAAALEAVRRKEAVRKRIVQEFHGRCILINAQADGAKARIDRDDFMSERRKEGERVHIERVRRMRIVKAKEETGYDDVDNHEAISQALQLPRLLEGKDSSSGGTVDTSKDTTLVISDQEPPQRSIYTGTTKETSHGSVARWLASHGWKVVKFCMAIPADPALKSTSVYHTKHKSIENHPQVVGAINEETDHQPGYAASANVEVRKVSIETEQSKASTKWPTESVIYEASKKSSNPAIVGWQHLDEVNNGAQALDNQPKVGNSHIREANSPFSQRPPIPTSIVTSAKESGTQWPHQSQIYEQSSKEASLRGSSITRRLREKKQKADREAKNRGYEQLIASRRMHLAGQF